jgi:hypothetical protein
MSVRPDFKELLVGCASYVELEPRDAMYSIATFLIDHFWGQFDRTAEALGVLLLTWNQAFYRGQTFRFDDLEECVRKWHEELQKARCRDIESYRDEDEPVVQAIFDDLLKATKLPKGWMSPVSAAKALHLLAPGFFALWDSEIATEYGCYWGHSSQGTACYLRFQKEIRDVCHHVVRSYCDQFHVDEPTASDAICTTLYREHCPSKSPILKSLVKIVDEYNYATFTLPKLRGASS